MNIIGINAFHKDAAACLVKNGNLVAAVADERLGNREKHSGGFPKHAILEVLREGSLDIKDVDYLAIGHDNNANFKQKSSYLLAHPIAALHMARQHMGRREKMGSFQEYVAKQCGFAADDCKFECVFVEHHLAHIASSYYSSPFDSASAFTYDGSGDFVSGMFGHCQGQKIKIEERAYLPHSLGNFYTSICQFIGFDQWGEEYKVMGLGAYGEPKYYEQMKKLVLWDDQLGYRLNTKYFKPLGKDYEETVNAEGIPVMPDFFNEKFLDLMGGKKRDRKTEKISQRDMDVASSCQKIFEEVVLHNIHLLQRNHGESNLVTAGGCALNGVCNARIIRESAFEDSYIQCAASDDGTSIGAALYVWNEVVKGERSPHITSAYWGPEHSDKACEKAFNDRNVEFKEYSDEELIDQVASLLEKGLVVGWYQGRAEWGPRALGNRSIIAHPGWPDMKGIINAKIKRRESFRPFAPSILAEEVENYFEQDIKSPFMMHVVKIREDKRKALAAVCHEDYTGRLQTVAEDQNKRYYDLIKKFGEKTGTHVVLNTSFNENEPIVDKPEHAVDCFLRTDMDALCLRNLVAIKKRN
jgi:carbamoyltransferase